MVVSSADVVVTTTAVEAPSVGFSVNLCVVVTTTVGTPVTTDVIVVDGCSPTVVPDDGVIVVTVEKNYRERDEVFIFLI